jgi:hypothetical protein
MVIKRGEQRRFSDARTAGQNREHAFDQSAQAFELNFAEKDASLFDGALKNLRGFGQCARIIPPSWSQSFRDSKNRPLGLKMFGKKNVLVRAIIDMQTAFARAKDERFATAPRIEPVGQPDPMDDIGKREPGMAP